MDSARENSIDGWKGSDVFDTLWQDLQERCGASREFSADDIEKACESNDITGELRELALATFSDARKIEDAWSGIQLEAYAEHFLKQGGEKPRRSRKQSLGGWDWTDVGGGFGGGDGGGGGGGD